MTTNRHDSEVDLARILAALHDVCEQSSHRDGEIWAQANELRGAVWDKLRRSGLRDAYFVKVEVKSIEK